VEKTEAVRHGLKFNHGTEHH